MILQDIQTRVKRTFGDESGAQITDDDIARWATDAQLNIVKETKCNQTTTDVLLIQGIFDYTIAQSITISMTTVNGTRIRSLSTNELNQRFPDRSSPGIPQGTPLFFTARDGGVGTIVTVYPTPDAAVSTMSVTHNMRPLPVVNPGDSFTIPEQYQEIVYRRCLERAYELDGQWNAAKTMNADAASKTIDARADSRDKDDSSYPAIRCLPGDQGN